MLPEGFGGRPPTLRSSAAAIVLRLLYKDQPLPKSPVSDTPLKVDRNQEIYNRYMAGERAVDLAKEFGISVRRINKLIRQIQLRKGD